MSSADPFAAVASIPAVAAAAAEARTAVDTALRHAVMRRRSAEVSVESGLRSARATAALEGADFRLEQVRAFAPPPGEFDPNAAVLAGALRLSAELASVRSTFEHAPLQAIARLHLLAAAEIVDRDLLGRPRTTGDGAESLLGLPAAPGPEEVSARLGFLPELLTARTTAPAVVISAIVHGELLALRPFAGGNGLVARSAARLVLVTRGLDVSAVIPIEVGHARDPVGYAAAAAAYIAGDVTAWVRHCCQAVELGAQETLATCAALERSG